MRQLSFWSALGIWAAVCLAGALYASWQGYGGRPYAATLTAFAFYLLVLLLFAARGVAEDAAAKLGHGGGFLLGACVFAAYVAYLLGTGSFTPLRLLAMAGFVFAPLALAMSAEGAAPGAWQDFLTLAGIWVFVKFSPLAWLWPYPGGKLAHLFTVLAAVSVAPATFLLIRRAKGVGYSIGWGKRWSLVIVGSLVVFAAIAIPLGTGMHFLKFAPQWQRMSAFIPLSVTIFLFTAWPEELMFRGLLQNFLARATKSDLAGWWVASMIFGLSHITNGGFPNWRYVILAALAGMFYGWTWRKTGSIFASAIVHAGVDALWVFFFRG